MMLGDHWLLIGVVLLLALVIFGPKRLPELGHSVGRALHEFKKAYQPGADDAQTVAVQAAPDGSNGHQVSATVDSHRASGVSDHIA